MNDPYLTYSDYILGKMSNTKLRELNDIIEFVTADDSELSELFDDEDIDQYDEVEPSSPLDYFSKFFPGTLLELIVDQANLYSVQKSLKYVDTNVDEMKTLIGMEILMGIIKLSSKAVTIGLDLYVSQLLQMQCEEIIMNY